LVIRLLWLSRNINQLLRPTANLFDRSFFYQLDTPILGPTILSTVVGYRRGLTIALGGETVGSDATLHKGSHDGLGAILGELLVGVGRADVVGVTSDDNLQGGCSLEDACRIVQRLV
jgi:hypothetical protein